MAAIVWADVESFASKMSAVDPDAQAVILGHVNTTLDIKLFGSLGEASPKLKFARILLAAHFGEMNLRKGAGEGAVTSETISAESISTDFAQADAREALLATSFGQDFLGIVQTTGAGLPVVCG